ncbi:MAG: B12-binding domain-containing radical SAM protein [Promethearchaeota archaeon]
MNQKILFIIPSFFYIENYQRLLYYNDLPLGVLQLSSFLKERANIETSIIDLRIEEKKEIYNGLLTDPLDSDAFKDTFVKLLVHYNLQDFEYVAISCYTSFQYLYTNVISQIVKEEFPHLSIIVGGYHPTAVPEDFTFKGSPFNYIIRGEAEKVLLEIVRNNDMKMIKNSNGAPLPKVLTSKTSIDVNSLPFPDYDLYLRKYPFKNEFNFDFYMSRGCPYQCAFCATNYKFRCFDFGNFKRDFQRLCNIVEEFNNKSPKISFADQSFNQVGIKRKVLEYILTNKLYEKFTFSCQSRVEAVENDVTLIRLFRRCKMIIGFGFETASKEMLKVMDKTDDPTHYIKIMEKILHQYKNEDGQYCRINLLSGFPGETSESFFDTIHFLEENALHENIQLSPSLFSNYPNVSVYSNMEYYEKKYGAEFIKEWWKLKSNPLKNSVPEKPSKTYHKKDLINDYKEQYIKFLRAFKKSSFKDLFIWKVFFNKWYREYTE